MRDPFTIREHTASDGYCFKYRLYAADSPRAHVVCVHGIQSHAGWYERSCTQLSEWGFSVSFLDRRGAGMNERDRGDAPSFRRLVDDVAEVLRELAGASGLPVFLAGISWGGKPATALQRRHPGLCAGLVLLCPGFFPQVGPAFRERLQILWSRLVAPRRMFPIPLNDPALFTASPAWQQFIRNDPLSLRQATARLLLESARLDGYLRFVPRYVHLPVLMLLAEHDRIIDNARTRRYAKRFRTEDCTLIEYAGAHHTLEFEPDPEVFLGDLRRWLEKQITQEPRRAPLVTHS